MTDHDVQIQIRALKSLDEMYQAAELQRTYWGNTLESVVPAHMMFTIVSYGGHVLAAMDGDKMIGVLIGMIGTDVGEIRDRLAMANLLMASKRMVVLPEYRGMGIGYNLKLAQRELAMKQGIRLVTWTFDPMQSRNAYLNLHKLGAVVQVYYVNYYGASSEGGLATFGVSDRLRADWWVTGRRVETKLSGARGDLSLAQYIEGNAEITNPTTMGDKFVQPSDKLYDVNSSFALIEVPLNFPEIVEHDAILAQEWQLHVRKAFDSLLRRRYVVTDFLHDAHEGRDRGFYLLSYNYGFDFSQN